MSKPIHTTEAGEQRFAIQVYADAETRSALYQLALQRAQSRSQVICDLIREAGKGKKK